jgi:hypothetical protein
MTLQEILYGYARRSGDAWVASWNAMSGTDQAEGHVYKLERDFYVAVAGGADVEEAIKAADTDC